MVESTTKINFLLRFAQFYLHLRSHVPCSKSVRLQTFEYCSLKTATHENRVIRKGWTRDERTEEQKRFQVV